MRRNKSLSLDELGIVETFIENFLERYTRPITHSAIAPLYPQRDRHLQQTLIVSVGLPGRSPYRPYLLRERSPQSKILDIIARSLYS